MTSSRVQTTDRADSAPPPSRVLPRLVVELVIGLGIAVLLVIVAWASSNAIRFVYGGY
jgi:hypothetical protein